MDSLVLKSRFTCQHKEKQGCVMFKSKSLIII